MLTALPPGSKAPDESATAQPVVDAEPIRAGESLIDTVNGLTGNGPADAHVHVGDDGALLMAQLEPIQAAGLTPAQLQEALANHYHDTNVIPNATVTVRRDAPPAAATQPTTAPANLADAQQQ